MMKQTSCKRRGRLSFFTISSVLVLANYFYNCAYSNDINRNTAQSPHIKEANDFTKNPYSLPLIDQYYRIITNQESNSISLDTIPGMVNTLMSDYWVIPSDSVCFKMTIGVSLDESYPSHIVRDSVFHHVNKCIVQGFDYDLAAVKHRKIINIEANTKLTTREFLSKWECIFKQQSSLYSYGDTTINYPTIPGSGCGVVCHIIHENKNSATYIIESIVDYHGSCGDQCKADYITIDKNSGQTLTVSDINELYMDCSLEESLSAAYETSAKNKGIKPTEYSGKYLLEHADGVALLKEGILFYYYPYSIGVGSEGQYNLIIPIK